MAQDRVSDVDVVIECALGDVRMAFDRLEHLARRERGVSHGTLALQHPDLAGRTPGGVDEGRGGMPDPGATVQDSGDRR